MKIVYLGSGEFGIECLDALAQSSHSLEFIATQPPHPAGRGRKLRPTPVAQWAQGRSMSFIEAGNINDASVIDRITHFGPDLIVVIAFGQKIGNQLIDLPPKGMINVHASLLPKYRGAAPINWVVINGESETGVSIIGVVEKMDAGDILAHARTDIKAGETAGQLHDRLAEMSAPLLLETIDKIAAGSAVYAVQDHSKVTLAPKLKKSDGFLDFGESAEVLQRKILGFWPWPGASASYIPKETRKCQRVAIAQARVVENSNPGGLAAGVLDENLNVICGENALAITKIKPAGGSLMGFEDFVRGRRTRPGDLFTKIEQ